MELRAGSGISWTTCKQSAPRSRQITTLTPHHSIFTGRVLFLTPNQQCQSTEGQEDCMSADHNHQILQMAQQDNKYPQFGKKLSYTVGGSVAKWLACWTQVQ